MSLVVFDGSVKQRWFGINAEKTADALVEYVSHDRDRDEWNATVAHFTVNATSILGTSLYRLQMYLSVKETNTRVLLIPFSNIIENEIVRRCEDFELRHNSP